MREEIDRMPNDMNLRRFTRTVCSFFRREGLEVPPVFSNVKAGDGYADHTIIPIRACFSFV